MVMRVPSDIYSTQLLKLPLQWADGYSQEKVSIRITWVAWLRMVKGEVAISLPFEIMVPKITKSQPKACRNPAKERHARNGEST
jgi:hypothetical protein